MHPHPGVRRRLRLRRGRRRRADLVLEKYLCGCELSDPYALILDIIKTPIVVIFRWLFQPKNDLLQVLPVPSAQRWTSFRLILWMVLTTASALAAGFAMRCGFFLSLASWRLGLIVRLICRRIRFLRFGWLILVSLNGRARLPGTHYQGAISAFKYTGSVRSGSAYC